MRGSRERRRLSVIATVAGAPLDEVQAAMCRPARQSMKSGANTEDAAAGGLPSSSVPQVALPELMCRSLEKRSRQEVVVGFVWAAAASLAPLLRRLPCTALCLRLCEVSGTGC